MRSHQRHVTDQSGSVRRDAVFATTTANIVAAARCVTARIHGISDRDVAAIANSTPIPRLYKMKLGAYRACSLRPSHQVRPMTNAATPSMRRKIERTAAEQRAELADLSHVAMLGELSG